MWLNHCSDGFPFATLTSPVDRIDQFLVADRALQGKDFLVGAGNLAGKCLYLLLILIDSGKAELLEYRTVRSSGGHESRRPVIITHVELMGKRWPVELTLANRKVMGFRMLLGREGMRGRFVVDPAASYLGGKRKKKRKKP